LVSERHPANPASAVTRRSPAPTPAHRAGDAPEPLVVYVTNPLVAKAIDSERLARIYPAIELETVPYEIDQPLRTARQEDPFSAALRRLEPPLTPEQARAFARAEVVLALDVPMDVPSLAPRLRWIQAIGSGVGQFVSARLPDGDIVLTNAASVGSGAIAEWVLGRILQIIKGFPRHDENAGHHAWVSTASGRFEGLTVTIVGLGAIGRQVARRARPFGVHLIGVRRSAPAPAGDPDVDELVDVSALPEVLGRSDVVVVSAPGTRQNENLFDDRAFATIKPGAVFLNVARGSLVDEDALMAALANGRLRAAAIDVARVEPLPSESPLWETSNLYISPHSSGAVRDYGARVVDLFCRNLAHYVTGEPLENVVDLSGGY
jgi:phosphoglycerate dehydrogenase-like enzyme